MAGNAHGDGLGSTDNLVKLATIGLIAISGGGNWLATKEGNDFNATEIRRATQEIHELYGLLGQAAERQKRIQDLLEKKQ